MVEVRRFGLARSRLTAIPSFASMTNRHFAKTLHLGGSHQSLTLQNKIQNSECHSVFYGGG